MLGRDSTQTAWLCAAQLQRDTAPSHSQVWEPCLAGRLFPQRRGLILRAVSLVSLFKHPQRPWACQGTLLRVCLALAGVAQLVRASPHTPKVTGPAPSRGTCLVRECGTSVWAGTGGYQSMLLSRIDVSLSPFLSSLPLKVMENNALM